MTDVRQGLVALWPVPAILTVFRFALLVLAVAPDVSARQARQARQDKGTAGDCVCSRTDTSACSTNHKYGYVLAWPKKLLAATGESAAGDGQIFKAAEGQAELRCRAGFQCVENLSLKKLFQMARRKPGFHVTYEHRGKNPLLSLERRVSVSFIKNDQKQ